jgi:pSer/pThr/pTyr-binding forkhead associated (FHA) protein
MDEILPRDVAGYVGAARCTVGEPGATPPGFEALRLVVRPGGHVFQVVHPDVLVGRHSDADLRLPLPDVSRRHCRLTFVNGGWIVRDLNSLNGVTLNGAPTGPVTPLKSGDTLRIGAVTFAVDVGPVSPYATEESLQQDEILQSIYRSLPPVRAVRRRAG